MIELLCIHEPAEREVWLRRELGMSARIASGDEITRRLSEGPGPAVLLMTEPQAYADILRSAPARSVIALVVSDPRCLPANRELIALPAVKAAFRPHSLETLSTPAYVATVAAGLSDARPASASPRQVAYGIRTGIQTRARIRAVCRTVGNRYSHAPLGYTNTFAEAFEAAFGPIAPDTSFFDVALGTANGEDRPLDLSFRGARGQYQRRSGIHLGSRLPRSDCRAPTRDYNGRGDGLDGTTYVEMLRSSRFALCPPGFVANESFRVYEALLCGALPVILATAISQGTRPARHLADVVSGRSWSAALRKMQRTNELERRGALRRALQSCRDAHREMSEAIRDLLQLAE